MPSPRKILQFHASKHHRPRPLRLALSSFSLLVVALVVALTAALVLLLRLS